VILPAANYDTKWPNDYEFFSKLGILEKDLSTIFVTATINLSETDGETGLQPIDYFACSKIREKALVPIVSNLDER